VTRSSLLAIALALLLTQPASAHARRYIVAANASELHAGPVCPAAHDAIVDRVRVNGHDLIDGENLPRGIAAVYGYGVMVAVQSTPRHRMTFQVANFSGRPVSVRVRFHWRHS
jgi:hypothetical protein